jgi:hypothetical protein
VARVAVSMFRARWILPVIPTLAILSLGGGCGGGGKEQVTAAQLVQKGDQICREERSSFGRIQAQPPPNASIAADQTNELIQTTEDANSKLGDLEPPEQLRAAYDQYLEARDRVIDEMQRGKDAAENQDSGAYGAAQAAVAQNAPQRRKLARSLGFKVCSSSPAAA